MKKVLVGHVGQANNEKEKETDSTTQAAQQRQTAQTAQTAQTVGQHTQRVWPKKKKQNKKRNAHSLTSSLLLDSIFFSLSSFLPFFPYLAHTLCTRRR